MTSPVVESAYVRGQAPPLARVVLPRSARRRRARGVRRLWRRVRARVPDVALVTATCGVLALAHRLAEDGNFPAELALLCGALGALVAVAHARVRRDRARREAAAAVRYIRRPWQPPPAACSTRARWSARSSAWPTRSSNSTPAPTG